MRMQDVESRVAALKKMAREAHVTELREEVGGEVKFVQLTVRFKVDSAKKTLDFCEKSAYRDTKVAAE